MKTAILLLVLAAWLLGSCSSPLEDADKQDLSALEVPVEQLPPIPAGRRASEQIDSELTGSQYFSKTTNANVGGNELELFSTAQSPSWGIWKLNGGTDALKEVQLLLDISAGNHAYVAVADYSTGRWSFSGPHESGVTIPLEDASHRSVNGDTYIAVLAAGGSQLNVVRLIMSVDRTGWQVVTVDARSGTGRESSILEVDGKPAIAYRRAKGGPDYDLLFAYSDTELGIDPDDWEYTVVHDGAAAGASISTAIIAGHPAIAYHESSAGELIYVRSTDALGRTESNWQDRVVVDTDGEVGREASMAVINGNPAIAYYDFSNDSLKYARSSTELGDQSGDWTTVRTVDSTSPTGRYPVLATVNGNPAIAYQDTEGNSINYKRSLGPNGSGPADWNSTAMVDASLNPIGAVGLLVADGNPAVFHTDFMTRSLHYIRSSTQDGTDSEEWSDDVFLEGDFNVNIHLSATLVNGNPAVAYTDFDNSRLMYRRSADSAGTGNGQAGWPRDTVYEASGNIQELDLAVVAGRPVISFTDAGDTYLKYAVLLD
ncbi:hypothetical protein KDL29_12245 [bacterium]|nr:hypothetical protein [bacterium]